MRFFTAALFAISTLAVVVLAQQNPIIYPTAGDKVPAGTSIEIKWKPTSTDKQVTLVLRVGDSKDLGTVTTIVKDTANDGTYTWEVPKTLPKDTTYAIEIVYSTGTNYSPQFEIDSDVTATTTAAKTTTTAYTTTTEATTKTATTVTATTTTLITSTVTSAPNSTVTYATIATTKAKTTTTTTKTGTSTGAPDPHNAAGLGKSISGGLVLVAAGLALMA